MTDYVPFASRPGWEHLQPIPQADAPNCLVPIAYAEQYRDAMDTFRAMLKAQEKSERSIELTELLIRFNPGHYSIWAYRAETLLALKADLFVELDLLDELVEGHLKSYQVWQHRRTIVTALESSLRELSFTRKALSYDSKNYHTWAYRQWALAHFFSSSTVAPETPASTSSIKEDATKRAEVWKGEIEYVDELLAEDVRNNSAWNHRFFVCFNSGEGGDVLEREILYAKTKLALSPNNPSAWNYLRGILKHTSTPFSSVVPFVTPLAIPSTPASPSEPTISDKAELPAYLAIEFLADAAANEGGKKGEEAAALFRSLIQYDPIRTHYWNFRADEVEAKAVGVSA